MKLLLDTHVLLWVLTDSSKLSTPAIRSYQDPENTVHVSAASFWELGIKISLGKLSFHRADWAGALKDELERNGIRWLPIDLAHCAQVSNLPFHHRDPFDRLLVAQALCEEMAMVTADNALSAYGVKIIW